MDCPKHSPDHPRSTGTATSLGFSSHLPRREATIEPRSRGNPVSYLMWHPRILSGSLGCAGEGDQ